MKQQFKHLYVLLASLLLIFVFYLPAQAAEEKEPTIIPLAQGQVLSGSFSDKESTEVYYSITITQEQAITIYGTQTEGEYVSLSLYDQNMKYVSHQSTVTTNANYKWRTKSLAPGNYYIGASSHFAAVEYTITYDPSPFPNAIPLAQGQIQTGSFSSQGATSAYYLITITQKQAITIYGTLTTGKNISLHLYDQDGNSLPRNSSETNNTNYRLRTDALAPGNYYIGVNSSDTVVDYTIAYDSMPYPNAILLERTQQVSSNLTSTHTQDIYKLVLTEPLFIAFHFTKNKGPYLDLRLYDAEGEYVSHMSTVTEDAKFSWSPNKKLPAGTYYLSVSGDEDNINYNIFWQIKGPDAVENLRGTKKTTNTITLKWKKASKASKYIVYTYNSKKKTYKKYKTVTSTTCKVKKLKIATKYKFKVVPVMKYGSEEIPGDEEIIETATAPKNVSAPTITFYSSGTLSGVPVNYYTVKWKKVKGATGYDVYVKSSKDKKWRNAGSTGSTSAKLYVVKGYSAQVKVRAYISPNTKEYSYGAFSSVKTINSR